MFLHIGNEDIVLKKDIIAILDIRSINKSQINKEFIKKNKNKGSIEEINKKNKEKSYIVVDKKVYQSSISSYTLKKRSDNFIEIINEQEK